ncbi:MAG: sigma 54-interacting transcriptional regulator, partial [Planctomycetota bacterium]
EPLVESELFGHEAGAFTGAGRRRIGHFEQARGGTLFLDEIGELPPGLQPKLLRALDTAAIRRVGGGSEIPVDLRLVSATNKDLEGEVSAGSFRLDLYYRLAVFVIEIPPLRERREEILPLARRFLSAAAGPRKQLSYAAQNALLACAWPGNVRELRNSVQRAAILAPGQWILPEHLPPALRGPGEGRKASSEGPKALAEIEKEAILQALERCRGNRTQAARELGISRRKLLYRLKEYEEGG